MTPLTAYRLMKALAYEAREEYEWERAYENLAEEYELEVETVMDFHEKYFDVVQEIEDDLFPDMWILSKEKRMQDYQRDVNYYMEELAKGWRKDLALEKRYIKRYVAEELGQLPSRMNSSANEEEDTELHYSIEGVDLGDLR